MAYAIIRSGGKQYRVEPGDVLQLESLEGEVGSSIDFPEVLMTSTESGLVFGTPLVADAKVSARILAHERGPKILVYKKKRRKNYRRHRGHRQNLTAVEVLSVG